MILAYLSFGLVISSIIIQVFLLVLREERLKLLIPIINCAGASSLAVLLISRSITINFVSLIGVFDVTLFFAFCLLMISAVYGFWKRLKANPVLLLWITILVFAFLALSSSPLIPKEAYPPVPALQSGWLIMHVTLAFIGESFFATAFISSILFLISKADSKKEYFDRLTYSLIIAGFPIFTLGSLIFGAVWAEAAWGSYWSWDLKEIWALATWLVYLTYLHLRLVAKKSKTAQAWLSIVGFIFTMFTFLGVSFLLPSAHSYLRSVF